MSTSDPLNKRTAAPDRMYYATGALLDKDDFELEQTYHRGRLARVLAYLHGIGTVGGLEVSVTDEDDEPVMVSAGLAVDRLGRLIEVSRAACLRLALWLQDQPNDDLLAGFIPDTEGSESGVVYADVFIKFLACERGKQPAFATGAYDALDAVAPSRLRDGYDIDLLLRQVDDETELPVPDAGFPDLSGLSGPQRQERVIEYKLQEAWRESSVWTGVGETLSLGPEHVVGRQDGTELLLARLRIPVSRLEDNTVQRNAGLAVEVGNGLRLFSYSTAELAWLTGI